MNEIIGRGAGVRPANRFERLHLATDDPDATDAEPAADDPAGRKLPTEYFRDDSQSIVAENQSPDLGFRFSVNPYRGCAHGCSYCYARPGHEYLGFDAGLDFETKVMVKLQAASLLSQWLARPSWRVEPICFSGVTDCYQPAERQFGITRGCLEVVCRARQPIMLITKNALVTRDLDLLSEMARRNLVSVAVSLTTLDGCLARVMEPRTSAPAARLAAIAQLSQAGVPTTVMTAPLIPGLNDAELPALLQAAAEAGARRAGYTLLRLPDSVRPVFLDWLQRRLPAQAARIESRIRATRSGRLNDSRFGTRMRGRGVLAEQIQQTFRVFVKRYGLDRPQVPLDCSQFRRPADRRGQLHLF